VKLLAELQAECAALEIKVETKGRASKEPYVAALRDYHWRRDHPAESLPAQIMPMLLGSWEDLDDAQAEAIEQDHHAWIIQPKLDGVRALLHVEDGRVRITSRTVSEVSYRLSEFQDNLPHLAKDLSGLNGTILDGDLVCPVSCLDTGSTVTANSLQATMAVLATSPNKARHFQEGQDAHVRFHVFDILRSGSQDVTPLPFKDRQDLLATALRKLPNEFIDLVPSFVVNKLDIHRRIIDAGGEGTVWKRADAPYEPGRRVSHWLTRKRGIEVVAFGTGFKRQAGKVGGFSARREFARPGS
jgi:bifunctional non-homologous end joining protein LigD